MLKIIKIIDKLLNVVNIGLPIAMLAIIPSSFQIASGLLLMFLVTVFAKIFSLAILHCPPSSKEPEKNYNSFIDLGNPI